MKKSLQIDFTAVKNFKSLNVSVQMLFLILSCTDANGVTRLKKKDFANYLSITEQTAGNHIKSYVNSSLIKYKYSGTIRVNPNFYYVGAPEDFEKAVREYEDFKSDM
ncbi:MAG: hypothetical protein IKB98_03485 [Clostridia bacterium]|nr:hypothetical protein [Clostridia bacterium]